MGHPTEKEGALTLPLGLATDLFGQLHPLPDGMSGRALTENDADQLIELRQFVVSGLRDPDFYVLEKDAFVHAHLGENGDTIGVFAGPELVAYGMIGLPSPDDPENMASVMGFGVDDRAMSAHLASAMVRRDYRGRELHKWLVTARLSRARALGRRHIFSMVAPSNDASWANLCRLGLHIRALEPLEGSRLRFLLYRDVAAEVRFDGEQTSADPLDVDTHRQLLAEGYWGIKRSIRSARCRLVYAAPSVTLPLEAYPARPAGLQ